MKKFKVGQFEKIERKITSESIEQFAELSGDQNPIHLDEEFASNSFFGERIAHGFLYGSLISAVLGTKLPGPGSIYISQEMNFKKPVFINDLVTAKVTVLEYKEDKSILVLETVCFKNENEILIDGKAVMKV
jgi:3-hydroxybutyryl-CoA dehydratase